METSWSYEFLSDDRLRMLFDTIAEVNSTLDLGELLVRVVDRSLDLTGAERGILILRDEEGEGAPRVARDSWRERLLPPVEYSRVVANRVLREGVSEVHELHLADTGEFPLTESIHKLGLRTVMCVPLVLQEAVIGVLYVDSRSSQDSAFGPTDLRLFEALAGQMAIAIENARLHEAELAKERLEARYRIAAEIQQGLVPPRSMRVSGLDIHGLSRPCEETGGDYFDILSIGEERVGLVVGDVRGHDLDAALYMLTARAHLRSALHWERDITKVLEHLDAELTNDMEVDRFMTLLFVDLDLREKTLRFVCAGHEPPLLFRAATGGFEALDGHGPMFNLRMGLCYRISEPVGLSPGDVFVLSTDGITEARSPGRELFGGDRLRRAVCSLHERPVEEIVSGVLHRVEAFAGDAGIEDDMTLVVAKVGD